MLTHQQIWGAIDALAKRHQLSPSALAKKAGLDPTALNKSKRVGRDDKLRWPSTESLAKILHVTNCSLEEFVKLLAPEKTISKTDGQYPPLEGFSEAQTAPLIDGQSSAVRNAPETIGWPDYPPAHAFAIKISGDDMEPFYREGDILLISKSANISPGDRIIIKLKSGNIVGKIFTGKNTNGIECTPFGKNAPSAFTAHEQIDWVARIIWASQ